MQRSSGTRPAGTRLAKTNLALAIAGLCTLPAFAESKLEEVTVVSSRVEMPLRQVATSVSVISAEELAIRGFSGIADALRYEPGISVNNAGGAGQTTALKVRGEQGYRTKLYIDDIEVTDPSMPQGGPNFENLVTAGVDRVEILRGPQGMMYGADAGGVVTVNTLRPTKGLSGGASAEYGRYSTFDYEGFLAGGNDVVDFALTGANYDTSGFNSRTTDLAPADSDGYENTTLHGRVAMKLTEQIALEGVARTVEGDTEYDTCFSSVTFEEIDDCASDYNQDAWRGAFVHNGETFHNSLSYNQSTTEREYMDGGVTSYKAEGELDEIRYLGGWSGFDALNFTYGVDLRNEAIDDGFVDTDRDQEGYFFEYSGSFADALYVTAGSRYDDNDDFGSETTYRAGAAWLLAAGDGAFKLKGTYGTGFRAPSLAEISYNTTQATPPASGVSLTAEESEGYDLGVGYFANSGWLAEVVYFDQTVRDEIYFDLIDFSGYLQGNGESTSEGIEVMGEVPLGESVLLTGNYTYNDTEDADGEQRLRAPEQMGNLGLRVMPWDARLVINLNLRASWDGGGDPNGEIEDYEVLDLSASYSFTDHLQVFGRIENVTDEDYEELPTYNTAGAAGYGGVRYTF